MPILHRLAVVLAALMLCAPAVATGQTTTVPGDGAGVSTQPPVQLGGNGSSTGQGATSGSSGSSDGELPNTGSDPRLLLLMGLALLLCGVGLRLRTADAELY